MADPLTDRQTDLIRFEQQWWTWTGAKPTTVADRFDVDLPTYDLELADALAHPHAADVFDPFTVTRLRRVVRNRLTDGPPTATSPSRPVDAGCPDCGRPEPTCRCNPGAA